VQYLLSPDAEQSAEPGNAENGLAPGPSPAPYQSATPEIWPEAGLAAPGMAAYQPPQMFPGQRQVWGEYSEEFLQGPMAADMFPPNWQQHPGHPGMQKTLWGENMAQLWDPVPLQNHHNAGAYPKDWRAPVAPLAPVPWAELDDRDAMSGGYTSTSATDHDESEPGKGRGKRNSGKERKRGGRKGEDKRQQPLDSMGKFPGGRLSWIGHIVELAREPTSSRMMQKELRESAGVVPGIVTKVVEEIAPGFAALMGDPVGNYFCQALLDVVPGNELASLVNGVGDHLVQIALSRHGTCAVQKLIHATVERAPDLAPVLTRGLMRNVVVLTNDLHGHYVIQCCLDSLQQSQSVFILEAMRGHCQAIATHRQGCLVLQKCFDRVQDDALVCLAEEIAGVAGDLAMDPFGNYVVQHVLKNCQSGLVQRTIALNLMPNFPQLSTQKFSSNVVELCFSVAEESTKQLMIGRLLEDAEGLAKIVKDQYGNYVIQSILKSATSDQVEKLLLAMRPALTELAGSQAGRRVLANFKKSCPSLNREVNGKGADSNSNGNASNA
jgi:hypothetical protein